MGSERAEGLKPSWDLGEGVEDPTLQGHTVTDWRGHRNPRSEVLEVKALW